ncbi:MAG: hybrid sensor histidine kinase/response regulator [Syntrophales bacterium]
MTTKPTQPDRRIATLGQGGAGKFSLLFNANPLPMAVHGRDGKLTDVNKAFLDTFSCIEEEIIGRRFSELDILAEPADGKILDKLLRADSPFTNHEIRIRRKDGVVLDCLLSGKPVLDKRRKYMLTVIIDETERKRALRNLEEGEARYRLLADHATDVVWMVDMTMRLIYISPSVEKLLGFTPEEAMKRTREETFTPETLGKSMQAFADGMQLEMSSLGSVNRSWKLEMEMYHKNGNTIPVEIIYSLLRDKEGTAKYIRANVKEITERKLPGASGENFNSHSHLKQKTESLERMAGAIAHNFNNLLGVVQGNLELARLLLPKGNAVEDKLAAAMKATHRAAEISSLMLTYIGKTHERLEPLDMSEACRRSLPLLQNSYSDGALLKADFPLPGPMVKANVLHIGRILTNLVANAAESLCDGRKLVEISISTVSAAEISTKYRFPAGWEPTEKLYACLKVRDEGCGIAENNIEKLFDPFFTSKFTGRGLGLPVVLGTARANSGCITVESDPGKGSAFSVYLPIIAGAIPAHALKKARRGEPVQTGAALLVDDELSVRQMTREMLEHMGFTVFEAQDGIEALAVFRRNRHEIRCVISDLTMPRMDGWKLLEALWQIAPGMPVILTSGYDQTQVMAGDHKKLPQAFLGKPYGLKGLKEAISQALDGAETKS